jgi:hypothetical protein
MSELNLEELKKTMPWQEVVHPNGLIQMIDKNGQEVKLLHMTAFLMIVTHKMAAQAA